MLPEFLERLDWLRGKMNRPMVLNSAYRCPKHNAAIGGAAESKHMLGMAVDINTSFLPRWELLKHAIDGGFYGIGVAKTFIHLDTRPKQGAAIWIYST